MHILTIYIRLPIDCVSTDGSASTSFVHANVNALMVTPIATRASSGRRVNLRTARQRHVARRPSADPRRTMGAAAQQGSRSAPHRLFCRRAVLHSCYAAAR